MTNYLLEKSRVVGPGKNERSFHVFYQSVISLDLLCDCTRCLRTSETSACCKVFDCLTRAALCTVVFLPRMCAGASAAERQSYCIENADYFYYLSSSGCYSVPGINDVEDWKEMVESMRVVGITDAERAEVMRALSVCLWLGNLAFCEKKSEVAEVQDRQVLDIIASLLQVPSASLEAALCSRMIQTGVGAKAERFTKPNTAADSDFSRDTLAKAVYTKLFDYLGTDPNSTVFIEALSRSNLPRRLAELILIPARCVCVCASPLVLRINQSIEKENFKGIQIGVLDIYGWSRSSERFAQMRVCVQSLAC